MKPVEKILKRLSGVRKRGGGWQATCPSHDDANPSLSISKGDDGRALLKCHAGCETKEVVDALELSEGDLFESRDGQWGGGVSTPRRNGATVQRFPDNPHGNGEKTVSDDEQRSATAQRCTLEEYAASKALPVEYLKRRGLRDFNYQGSPAVRIPYHDAGGPEFAVRFRTALEKSEDGPDNRFRWRGGSKAMLYGLEGLERIRKAGYVVLVEGESDRQTLDYHSFPALGIPGASTWRSQWAEHLEGVERVYVVAEPDEAGERLRDRLGNSTLTDKLYIVELGEHKDASGLYLSEPDNFKENIKGALSSATAYADLRRAEVGAAAREAWSECAELAAEPDILQRFADELAQSGVAGESRLAKLLYLAVTSRLLQRPASVAMKGPSSGGKSYLTEQVLRFFPDSAYYSLTAMSEHALAYSEEPLVHRFLVIYEAAGMESDFQTYLIRSLLSEGCVRYETVEKTSEGMKPRLIERAGPTGLIVTTTAVKLHPENETRLLSLTVTDSQEQTRDIFASLAAEADGYRPDMGAWHALQEWLSLGAERRVTIPYASKLAELVPPVAVRLRRDFGAVLTLIRAHALLHQASRDRDEGGQVVAAVADYAAVRLLVADLVSEGVEATVPATVRATVQAVASLYADSGEEVTVRELATELKLDKSTTSRRIKSAIDKGFVKNMEDRRGKPGRYKPDDPLPADVEILPPPDKLEEAADRCGVAERCSRSAMVDSARECGFSEDRCSVAALQEGVKHPPPPSTADTGRRLTADEAAQVQKLIRQGMKPSLARREIIGGD